MCTGDHRAAAEAVAKDCGIDKDRVAPGLGFLRVVGIFTDQHGHAWPLMGMLGSTGYKCTVRGSSRM